MKEEQIKEVLQRMLNDKEAAKIHEIGVSLAADRMDAVFPDWLERIEKEAQS